MADLREASITLPAQPLSVSRARRYATASVTRWGLPPDDPLVDTVRLIVSELATNAVLHTFGRSPTFTLALVLDRDEELRVGVADSYPRWPKRLPAAVAQDNGRGLIIMRWLAVEAGGRLSVTPASDGGKTVWITLPWVLSAVG
jgi:anti-sigma regulatory factor (Ser/Thr protein kinase)